MLVLFFCSLTVLVLLTKYAPTIWLSITQYFETLSSPLILLYGYYSHQPAHYGYPPPPPPMRNYRNRRPRRDNSGYIGAMMIGMLLLFFLLHAAGLINPPP